MNTTFNWRAKPSETAKQLKVDFVRNKNPVPIVYNPFQKTKMKAEK